MKSDFCIDNKVLTQSQHKILSKAKSKMLYFLSSFFYKICMNDETFSTSPKPFVFVLMPFDEKFDDIYKFGIKGTAEEVGAYAERVDEQIFTEGILERIFNQINKADLIVADMTGRNPNVFYEVGYAHSLGKIVLLLTQDVDDIPFDLKHRQHIVYGNKIQYLRKELSSKLTWAINESTVKGKYNSSKRIIVSICVVSSLDQNKDFHEIQEDSISNKISTIGFSSSFIYRLPNSPKGYCTLKFQIHNNSSEEIPVIKHIYLFTSDNPILRPLDTYSSTSDEEGSCELIYNSEKDDKLANKYILRPGVPSIAPNADETFNLRFLVSNTAITSDHYKLRIHILNNYYDFSFLLDNSQKV